MSGEPPAAVAAEAPRLRGSLPEDRVCYGLLLALAAVVALAVSQVQLPEFWGDAATYHGMAHSLAEDLDLRYEARDIARIRREFPGGPQGVFLKRTAGGLEWHPEQGFPWLHRGRYPEAERPIFFAKAFIYPLAAAPFVRIFGTSGMLVANATFLGLALWLGYGEVRRRARPYPALLATLALFGLSVAPLYVLWPAPEVFNLGVLMAALASWRRGRPLLSAVLFGLAFYSKPYNLFVALPLAVEALLPGPERPGVGLRALEMLRRGLVMAVVGFGLFTLNAAITGEANYQGGERKTFYGQTFPLESKDVTFGNSGIWMTTNQPGPAVEGRDNVTQPGAEPPRTESEIRDSFVRNLGYFWVGRFGGVLPYYAAAFVALLWFLLFGPRDGAGWLAVAATAVSYLFYILMIPDNWYGGGGTVGNRYFLNLLPLAVYVVPRRREFVVTAAGLLGALVFLGPIMARPLHHSLHPGDHATRGAFRLLPAELTMLNDLSVFTEPWRKKRPVGDTEGDPHLHWPADPKAYYLYFPDDGTYGREEWGGKPGFWLRGGERAEVLLRALEPVSAMTLELTANGSGDHVSAACGGAQAALELGPGQAGQVELRPAPGFVYKDSFVYVLRLRSERAGAGVGPDGKRRELGAFVHVRLAVAKRTRQ